MTFLPSDLDRVLEAVQEAERGTSGEIVPYIVPESDDYSEAIWRVAAVSAAAALVLLSAAQVFLDFELRLGIIGTALITILFSLFCSTLVAVVPSLRRRAAGRALIARRTLQRAEEAFIAEEVFATADRIGILLFISLMEHRVIVLGDTGINQRVAPEEWSEVVTTITNAIGRGRTAEGIVEAIHQCSEILLARGFIAGTTNPNELPDMLRRGG